MWFMIQHDVPSQTSQVWPHKGTESHLARLAGAQVRQRSRERGTSCGEGPHVIWELWKHIPGLNHSALLSSEATKMIT